MTRCVHFSKPEVGLEREAQDNCLTWSGEEVPAFPGA
ncbi:hypothetical protein Poly30_50410 [Planctomycetes bacterium Poly30]|uniref:Uncharacterized protein n=1 Tax=Saltatorellus ferox TaxID=2528018 RepID=A0A518EZG6_9BACT|nr:hypothetical protein Poly30_50410 [Planctomycetes bacterium Poly30]